MGINLTADELRTIIHRHSPIIYDEDEIALLEDILKCDIVGLEVKNES